MKQILKTLTFLGICAMLSAWGASLPSVEVTAAVHAIQQAPDPSAAVAAYANGMAVDRTSPVVYAAYVARMVDFGLPEMAYRQARTLTSLVPSDGLAWGVVAYAEARRGNMPEAVASLSSASQFAPEHPFVQRTAGEIVAWSDLQADGTQLSPDAKAGLDKVRSLLDKRPAYVTAYETARKAYQNRPNPASGATPESGQSPTPELPQRPSLVETNVPPTGFIPGPLPPLYAQPDYAWDTGPVWVEPDPSWWWYPAGVFSGICFVPYSYVVFGGHGHYHDHGHEHDRGGHGHWAGHTRSWDHLFPQHAGEGRGEWHRDRRGHPSFYGPRAQPNPNVAQTPPPSAARPSGSTLSRDSSQGLGASSVRRPWNGSTLPSSSRSWSILGNRPAVPSSSPRFEPSYVPPVSSGRPSWSVLGRGSGGSPAPASPSLSGPRMSSPGGAPSWSTLGRGSAPSAPARSAAPSSSGGTSGKK